MGTPHRRHLQAALIAAALFCGPLDRAEAYDCSQSRYDSAHKRMDLAFRTGVLSNDPRPPLSVFISERFWTSITFQQKQEFADALVCAVAGPGKGLSNLNLRSDMTGKIIGDWSWGKLTVP